MKRQRAGAKWMALLATTLAAAAGVGQSGCATRAPARTSIIAASTGSVMYGAFIVQGEAQLTPKTPLRGLYNVGDTLYAYTNANNVYALSQALEIRYIEQVAPTTETLRPPVQVAEQVIFPTSVGLKIYTKDGAAVRTLNVPHPLSSDVRVDQRGMLLMGMAAPTGGRVGVIDPTRTVRVVDQEVLVGNVMSAPVSFQGIIYAANDRGEVFAIAPENRGAWPLEGMSFKTGRSILADLVIDDYALYVAAMDTKLYALDRGNGQIRWRYMAEVPLKDAPLVTQDRVYQIVPERGLVALGKTEGKLYREPVWTAPGVTKVISADDRYVYAAHGNNRIVALGIADGQEKFGVSGRFDHVTAGADGRLFAASSDGRVVSLKRGPYTGG